MKNKELFDLKNVLIEMIEEKEYRGIEFSYFVIKNKKLVEQQCNLLEELIKDNAMEEFEKNRIDILTEFSKDDTGTSVTKPAPNNRIEYVINESRKEEFASEMNKLKDKYSVQISEYSNKINEYNVLLEKDFVEEVPFTKISKEKLPNNISLKHFNSIFDLIEM